MVIESIEEHRHISIIVWNEALKICIFWALSEEFVHTVVLVVRNLNLKVDFVGVFEVQSSILRPYLLEMDPLLKLKCKALDQEYVVKNLLWTLPYRFFLRLIQVLLEHRQVRVLHAKLKSFLHEFIDINPLELLNFINSLQLGSHLVLLDALNYIQSNILFLESLHGYVLLSIDVRTNIKVYLLFYLSDGTLNVFLSLIGFALGKVQVFHHILPRVEIDIEQNFIQILIHDDGTKRGYLFHILFELRP